MRVLVTGAASGLGAALVARFAERGDHVLACDIEPSRRETGRVVELVETRRLDVTSDLDWHTARAWVEEHWGGLDVLVNNAGVAGGGRIEHCDLDDWQRLLEVNLLGVVRGTRTFVPMLKAQGSGRIVNTVSLAGLVHPPGMGSYNATKAAVVAFSETAAHELAPYGVGCTAVCPSYFRTGLMRSMVDGDPLVSGIVARQVETSPISADDIAVAVLDGLDRGLDLVVPDEPARQAYALKVTDHAAYTAQLRRMGESLRERDA